MGQQNNFYNVGSCSDKYNIWIVSIYFELDVRTSQVYTHVQEKTLERIGHELSV